MSFFKKRLLNTRTVYITKRAILNNRYRYPPNIIKNQKYSILTFFPLVLYDQFSCFFNLYFLAVCVSQFFRDFVVGYLFTYFSPLLFVLSITILKEASDDFKRYRRDKEANSQIYKKLTPEGLNDVLSYDIRVGDILFIKREQRIPADIVLLKTTDKSGSAFIRTDQLDGETDWKLRNSVPSIQKLENFETDIFNTRSKLFVEKPHKDIYSFIGTITMYNSNIESLSIDNTMWMNTVLASNGIYGIVIFTGKDTRTAMNTNQPSSKYGQIDNELNTAAKLLFAISLIMSLSMVCMKGFFGPWPVYLVRFFILFSSIIPLSLKVNVDMARIIYSQQISNDHDASDIIVRNSNLPEELGRVGYLLSDKTGTLTRNDMELKRIHLGSNGFSMENTDEMEWYLHTAHKALSQDTGADRASGKGVNSEKRELSLRIYDLVKAVSLCHNVTPITESNGDISYQASSPDEIAILKWAHSIGFTLVYRDRKNMQIKRSGGEIMDFEIIEVFPFTSDLKRMGVLVRDCFTNEIVFYMKGADSVMGKIVQYSDWLDEECGNMAREGLRTLVVAKRRLSEAQLEEFAEKYHAAKISIKDRNKEVRSVVSGLLECDLEVLGVTGVEDRLQDDVKITLETLRNAGIRVWMLTGDKVETATCIATSSRLIARNQNVIQIQNVRSASEGMGYLNTLQSQTESALIIDGISLQTMCDNYSTLFLKIASDLPAVICCRCTPTQKADMATLIKGFTQKRICCIGDGGNDVSMIQAADVGVGLVGKEGRQASLAADFSLRQFSHITKLLLWHGRNSYKRTAKLSQFVIHRGIIIAVMQAVFSSIFFFSPIPLYQGFLAVGYCTIYTTLPVFSLVLDKDIKEDMAIMYPELYKELTKGRCLSYKTFFTWILVSVYQGGIMMLISIWLFETDFIHIVSITFTSLILNELLMVALQINTWHYLMVLAEFASILIYVLSLQAMKYDFDVKFSSSFTFLWKVSVITLASFLPLFIINTFRRLVHPPNYSKLS